MIEKRNGVVALIMLLTLVWWIFGVTGTLRLGMVGVETADDRITKILPGSPAEQAGLRVGDGITSIEGDEGTVGVGRTLIYSIERDGEVEHVSLQAAPWRGAQRNVMLATILMGLLHLLCGGAAWFAARGKIAKAVAPSVPIPGGLGAYPYTLLFVLTPIAFLYVILKRRPLQHG